MSPKKAPPPPPMVTLHLYRPSGDFVIEVTQSVQGSIARFAKDLEEGSITPALDLELGDRVKGSVYYLLVFNGVVLREGLRWGNAVVELGMSTIEPNDITVVLVESRQPISPTSMLRPCRRNGSI